MYVTAQRVRSQVAEGANAYLYLHGLSGSPFLPPLEGNPGTLVNTLFSVQPAPANMVLSYLDIAAPDDAFWPEIQPELVHFVLEAQRHPFPWEGVSGRMRFHLAMDAAHAVRWKDELAILYQACRLVFPIPLLY